MKGQEEHRFSTSRLTVEKRTACTILGSMSTIICDRSIGHVSIFLFDKDKEQLVPGTNLD